MIAGGGGNDSALLLFGRQLRKRVACAPFLETTSALDSIQLAVNLHPGDFTQRNGMRTRRVENRAFYPFTSRLDILERYRHPPIYERSVGGNAFDAAELGVMGEPRIARISPQIL